MITYLGELFGVPVSKEEYTDIEEELNNNIIRNE